MTRVIHTGDTHVGYRQYHSPERRQDFLDAFQQVIDDAVESDVDAVVHAGDLFHDRRPDLPDLMGVLAALRDLESAGIPFLAVVGNHESTRGGQWLDLFESLGLATRLGDSPETVGNTAFYGLDHVPESQRDDLEYDYESTDAEFAALVSHGLFEPFAHADWDTETVLESATVDFDAVLLGDNHVPDTARVRDTWVTYCGSTERASTSERDGRGYNLVTFEDEVDIRRRSLETREFVFVEAELGPGEGTDRVRDRVGEYDVEDAVVIVEITGEGDPVTPAEIESFATERGALIARVTDRREIDTETDISVDFADPDRAVRERLSELDLSESAREIDDIVRDSGVVDSNVRDRVTRRVRDRLDRDGETVDADSGADTDGSASDSGDSTDDADGSADGSGDSTDDTGDSTDDTGDSADDAGEQVTMEDLT